jgi:Ca-activated chloride channel family protein
MTFIWPQALLLLVLVPLGIGLDRLVDRRRRRGLAALGGLRAGATGARGRGFLRRVPPVLFVAGLIVLIVGLARPQGIVGVPRQEGTVILAFDISGSMAATDLTPTRMDAAKAAAKDFIARQPASVVVGVVAFSDSGVAVQQPTNDQLALSAAIDRLTPQRGTSVGRGIQASLDVIATAAAGPNVDYYTQASPAPTPEPTPVPEGFRAPAVIVLLTDGENNERPDPSVAAQSAVDRGVRIFTIGIGSPGGADLDLNGFTVHTQLDEASLQQIADTTGGAYYAAADAASLLSIYDHLDTNLVVRQEDIELTAIVAAVGLVLLVLGGLASLRWLGRVP